MKEFTSISVIEDEKQKETAKKIIALLDGYSYTDAQTIMLSVNEAMVEASVIKVRSEAH